MANNTLPGQALDGMPDLPYKLEHYTVTDILLPIWPIIILFGIFSNITNITVFSKLGVKDNVSILLLSLSVSDLAFLVLITPTVSSSIISNFVPSWSWPFDKKITAFLFYWPAFTLYDFSAYIAVFLGVMRCACVALPLHFRSVFTRTRTIVVLVALFFFTILLRLPVLTTFSLSVRVDPLTNSSRVYLKSHGTQTKVFINDTLNRSALPWLTFIIMVACVLILSIKLHQSARLWQNHASVPVHVVDSNKEADQAESFHQTRMSKKENHVIQSVVLVCIIYILSQLPFLLYSTARLIQPEFDQRGSLIYLFGIFTKISMTCAFLNASVNIFVYYNYNSKYKSICQALLCFSSKERKIVSSSQKM